MNFYDVLAAEKWGGGIPTINFFDLLFAQSISGKQWQVYEGTLPATLNANGDDMRQYQVWGAAGGVGDRTVQLFDKNATDTDNGYIAGAGLKSDGTLLRNNSVNVSEYIPISGNTVYILRYGLESGYYDAFSACFYDISKNFISGISYSKQNPKLFTTPAAAAYARFSFSRTDVNAVVLAKGSTIPEPLPPYGYKLDMVSGTRNLWDINANDFENSEIETVAAKGYIITGLTPNANYTMSTNCPKKANNAVPIWFGGTSSQLNGVSAGESKTAVSNASGEIYVYYRTSELSGYYNYWYMLNEGSTALPYQPYSNNITPIYIGDEPLWAVNTYADCADYQKQKVTRAIKKYVLTGDENWEEISGAFASRTYFRYVFAPINYCVRHVCTSSHFTQASITTATTTVGFDVFDSSSVNGEVLAIRPANVQSTTLTDFKVWLAEQYAAGTPVTVWCALTTAEETDPPVALPALPTCEGTTVIDYAGQSVAPEKVYFEYQGGKQP